MESVRWRRAAHAIHHPGEAAETSANGVVTCHRTCCSLDDAHTPHPACRCRSVLDPKFVPRIGAFSAFL